ncbi:hypothetical protein BGY98DRAFT_1003707, partial [Russula aff. rugulosa BPL654]
MQPLPPRHLLSWVLHKNVLFADSCYCPCYPAPQTQKPVPREQPAEASSPTEGLQQRASDLTGQGQV